MYFCCQQIEDANSCGRLMDHAGPCRPGAGTFDGDLEGVLRDGHVVQVDGHLLSVMDPQVTLDEFHAALCQRIRCDWQSYSHDAESGGETLRCARCGDFQRVYF